MFGKSGNAEYPWMFHIDPTAPSKANLNFNTLSLSSGLLHNSQVESSGADGDYLDFDVLVPAGTWNFTLIHNRNLNHGIYSIQFDLVEQGTIDGYYASNSPNTYSTLTGIVVPVNKKFVLRIKISGKNASSSGYFGSIQEIHFRRTA